MSIRIFGSVVTIGSREIDFGTTPPEQLHFDEDVRIPTQFPTIIKDIEGIISGDIANGLGESIHEIRISAKGAFALLAEMPSLVDDIVPETGLIGTTIRFETTQKIINIPVRIDETMKEHLVATVDINGEII